MGPFLRESQSRPGQPAPRLASTTRRVGPMAHTVQLFYNVDKAVGKGRPNLGEDVLLVKFFMKEIHDFDAPMNSLVEFPEPELTLDTSVDDNLFAWILAFQKLFRAMGTACALDGVVDHAPGTKGTRTPGQTIYTIVLMSTFFQTQQPDIFPKLPDHPHIPGDLATKLRLDLR